MKENVFKDLAFKDISFSKFREEYSQKLEIQSEKIDSRDSQEYKFTI